MNEQQQLYFEAAELNLGFLRFKERSHGLRWSHQGNHITLCLWSYAAPQVGLEVTAGGLR